MKILSRLFILSSCFIFLSSFGQLKKFNFKRKLSGNNTQDWYTLKFPNEIFEHIKTPGFADVRIYNKSSSDTMEVPYIIRILEDEITEEIIDLPVFNQSRKGNRLYFTFELKDGKTVNYIDLNFEQTNYNAFVKIEGSHNQKEWFDVVRDKRIVSIQQESVYYHNATVFFPKSNYKFLRVSIQSDVLLQLIKTSFRNQVILPGTYLSIPSTWSVHEDKKTKQTTVDVTLKNYVPITQVNVKVETDHDYYRAMKIEYAYDSVKNQAGWKTLYYPLGSFYVTSINPNNFICNKQFAKAIRLVIANQDNTPLKISDIEVLSPQVELVTKLVPGEFYLFYGNENIENPSYDLIHFKENIPDALKQLTLGYEESLVMEQVSTSPLFLSKIYLWAILALAILVLAFFTLRMMKEKKS